MTNISYMKQISIVALIIYFFTNRGTIAFQGCKLKFHSVSQNSIPHSPSIFRLSMSKKKRKRNNKSNHNRKDVHFSIFTKTSSEGVGEGEGDSNSNNICKVPPNLPKLLVFDLDNTLWTPELYQIRTKNNVTPQIGSDIRLFPGVQTMMIDFAMNRNDLWKNVQFGIASRTDRIVWAEELLTLLEAVPGVSLNEIFQFREIVPGSKRYHFEKLHETTKVSYNEMIFFDDDANLNLREIETMGVLCCHCPRGMNVDLFRRTLWKYSDMKSKNKKAWMGITVNARSLPKL